MRALVCGSRTFGEKDLDKTYETYERMLEEQELVNKTLSALLGGQITDLVVVHGDAPGADRYAAQWARLHDVPVEAFPADWSRFGRAAGPLRNAAILVSGIDLVIAFPGGAGTADMCKRAQVAGVSVVEVATHDN